jgi:hypothetical protein
MATTASAPRILILDNDETTGSYHLLFFIESFLNFAEQLGHSVDYNKTIQLIAAFCLESNILRPGMQRFIREAIRLKRARRIDKIVIYTNQLSVAEEGFTWSTPEIIADILSLIADDPHFIDLLITRDSSAFAPQHHGYVIKDLVRPFTELYPTKTPNFSKTLFIDDRAFNPYAHDSSRTNTSANSFLAIPPYKNKLPYTAIVELCLQIMLVNNMRDTEDLENTITLINREWVHTNDSCPTMNDDPAILNDITKRLKQFYSKHSNVTTGSGYQQTRGKASQETGIEITRRQTKRRSYPSPKT